jgi:hypothetical protein
VESTRNATRRFLTSHVATCHTLAVCWVAKKTISPSPSTSSVCKINFPPDTREPYVPLMISRGHSKVVKCTNEIHNYVHGEGGKKAAENSETHNEEKFSLKSAESEKQFAVLMRRTRSLLSFTLLLPPLPPHFSTPRRHEMLKYEQENFTHSLGSRFKSREKI